MACATTSLRARRQTRAAIMAAAALTALSALVLALGTPALGAQSLVRHAARTVTVGDRAVAAGVPTVGVTVSDMDRAVDFYTRVLSFEKVSDVGVAGAEWEHLAGVFGARSRVVRLRLGAEQLELTEYLAPRGRPVPVDSRSEDRWFQHVAIIVRDPDGHAVRIVERR
jgi:catechol 2,3-dioxygenase-like lactoylglutathione lyase family enzyme